MKKAYTLRDYQRVGDAAGVMVMTLLAYRKAIRGAVNSAKQLTESGKTLTKGQQLYLRMAEKGKDTSALDRLEETFAGRAP